MRLASDLKQLEKRQAKQFTLATSALKQLESQRFACQPDATSAAIAFSQQLPYDQFYSLGQRSLRHALARPQQTIDNQVGKPRTKPTLRWVFQCFMSIHLLTVNGVKFLTNLTQERLWILQFFGAPCRKYYLLS